MLQGDNSTQKIKRYPDLLSSTGEAHPAAARTLRRVAVPDDHQAVRTSIGRGNPPPVVTDTDAGDATGMSLRNTGVSGEADLLVKRSAVSHKKEDS